MNPIQTPGVAMAPVASVREGQKPGKVPLKPGRSLFHWAKRCDAEPDLAGRRGAPFRTISIDELQRHSTLDDGWCAISGRVYNVTPYLEYHPGGAAIFAQVLGDDATDAFAQYHPFVNAHELCGALELGTLAAAPARGAGGGGLLVKLRGGGTKQQRANAAAAPPAAGVDGWIEGTVVASTSASDDAVRLTVGGPLPGGDQSAWARGAHLMVTLPAGLGSARPARRPYTPFVLPPGAALAADSSPTQAGTSFELLVRPYAHGHLSRPLGALDAGAKLLYRGPLGGCAVGVRSTTRAVAMLAGGTGVTPMLQLLTSLCRAHDGGGQSGVEVLLLTFNTSRAGVLLRAELERLARRHAAWLRVQHCCSNESGGRLSAELLSKALPRPSAAVQVFVCGPPAFNDAARAALAQLGHADAHVFS